MEPISLVASSSAPLPPRCLAKLARCSAQLRPYASSLRRPTTTPLGCTRPPMSTLGSRATSLGFIIMLLSASAGIHFGAGGFALLLSFTGILTGANLVAAGVRMADEFGSARAVAAFVRRNTTAVGLVMASCAVMAASNKTEHMLCFAMFTLLLLGVSLINMGARGE